MDAFVGIFRRFSLRFFLEIAARFRFFSPSPIGIAKLEWKDPPTSMCVSLLPQLEFTHIHKVFQDVQG